MKKAITIPPSLLEEAGKVVSRWTGLHFPEARREELERGLRSALRELGFEDPMAGIRWLICAALTSAQIQVLAGHLTVGETYFFRDRKCFEFLEWQLFPELVSNRRKTGRYLRIWSAGCCSGEEAYSLVILLAASIPDMKEWNISLLGTDINPQFLKKACAGVYGEWSFRNTPAWVRERFFTRTGNNRSEISPDIRKRVTFTYHNLVDDRHPSLPDATAAMDLILCRNVLMYLGQEHQEDVVRRLKACLAEGGWLIVGPSEVSEGLFRDFRAVRYQGATFYRKSLRETAGAPSTLPAEDMFVLPPGFEIPARLMERIPPVANKITPPGGPASTVKEMGPVNLKPDPYEEGLLLYEKGLYAEAVGALAPLLSDGSRAGRAAALLAHVFVNQGKLPEAISMCDKAISAEKVNPAHYYLRAIVFQEQEKPEKAVADLRTALYLDQDFVPAHLFLANLALRQGKKGESARHYRNAFKLLSRRPAGEVIPAMEGLTAGRIMEMIRSAGFEDVA